MAWAAHAPSARKPEKMVSRPNDFPHLINEHVREMALASFAKRIDYLKEDQWYNLHYAAALLRKLEAVMLDNRKNIRPTCLRIVAATGMAKSTILEQFLTLNPPVLLEDVNMMETPVLKVEMPDDPTAEGLYEAFLYALGAPIPVLPKRRIPAHCVRLLVRVKVQIIIIDEYQRILWAPDTNRRRIGEACKFLANALRIPVIVAGTNEMDRFFDMDPQLNDRFPIYEIAPLLCDQRFREIVSTILSYCPMRQPPEEAIFSEEGCKALLEVAGNSTAALVRHIKRVVTRQFEGGEEGLTLETLLKIK